MHRTEGEMNYHAALRGPRQLPDQVGVTVEGKCPLSHHGSPRHPYYISRIHIQPRKQGSIFCAPEISFCPAQPPKKTTHMRHKVKRNNTHATQSKAKHSKKRPHQNEKHQRTRCETRARWAVHHTKWKLNRNPKQTPTMHDRNRNRRSRNIKTSNRQKHTFCRGRRKQRRARGLFSKRHRWLHCPSSTGWRAGHPAHRHDVVLAKVKLEVQGVQPLPNLWM